TAPRRPGDAVDPRNPSADVPPTATLTRIESPPPRGVARPLRACHALSGPPTTVLEPTGGWRLVNVRELWRYRELLYFLVWRDVKVRYKQTVLGAAWAVLQPALMMVVFTVFLRWMAGVPSGDCPYPLFAYLGFLPWSFFASAI